jgi:hypothetical protein
MTRIHDSLTIDREQSNPSGAEPQSDHGRSRPPRRRTVLGVGAALVVGAGLAVAAVQLTASTGDGDDRPRPATRSGQQAVVGAGPDAVFVGPAPEFGGDPVGGETDASYFGRTGRHLPGLGSATQVDGEWWHGPAPVHGGDPVPGETDDSYFARTGRHLPPQFDTREQARRELVTRDLVARGLIPAATLDDPSSSANTRSATP